MVLACKALGGDVAKGAVAVATKWEVVLLLGDRAILVDDDAGAAQMVAQNVEDAVVAAVAAAPHGDGPLCTRVVAGAGTALVFVDPTNIDGGHTTHGSLDAVAVGVVDEGGDGAAALLDRGDAVLVVEDQRVSHAANGARGLVAVGIVAVRVAVGKTKAASDVVLSDAALRIRD